jgi:hypothetical protein
VRIVNFLDWICSLCCIRLAYDNKRWLLSKLRYDEELTRLLKLTCIIILGIALTGLWARWLSHGHFYFCLAGSSREQIMRLAVQRLLILTLITITTFPSIQTGFRTITVAGVMTKLVVSWSTEVRTSCSIVMVIMNSFMQDANKHGEIIIDQQLVWNWNGHQG